VLTVRAAEVAIATGNQSLAAGYLDQVDEICVQWKLDYPCSVAAKLRPLAEAGKVRQEAATAAATDERSRRAAIEAKIAEAKGLRGTNGYIFNNLDKAVRLLQLGRLDEAEKAVDGLLCQAAVPNVVRSAAIPDINGDGKNDLVAETQSGDTVVLATTAASSCTTVYRMDGTNRLVWLFDKPPVGFGVLPSKTNGWSDLEFHFHYNHQQRYVEGDASVTASFDGVKYRWAHLTCDGRPPEHFDAAIDCDWAFVALNPDRDEVVAARKKEAEEMKAASEATLARCEGDMGKCRDACAKDVASYECAVLGVMYQNTDKVWLKQHLGLNAPDDQKAASMLQAGCVGGSKFACNLKTKLDERLEQERQKREQQKERQTARVALPGLFAQCRQLKARYVALRALVNAAAYAHNREKMMSFQPEMEDLTHKIREVGNRLTEAVATATNQEDPEYARLIEEVRQACVPSGW
jgi:soluble cytochrome b562